jgi:hypothetical protein
MPIKPRSRLNFILFVCVVFIAVAVDFVCYLIWYVPISRENNGYIETSCPFFETLPYPGYCTYTQCGINCNGDYNCCESQRLSCNRTGHHWKLTIFNNTRYTNLGNQNIIYIGKNVTVDLSADDVLLTDQERQNYVGTGKSRACYFYPLNPKESACFELSRVKIVGPLFVMLLIGVLPVILCIFPSWTWNWKNNGQISPA